MKRFIGLLTVLVLSLGTSVFAESWLTDSQKAIDIAKKDGKYILVWFATAEGKIVGQSDKKSFDRVVLLKVVRTTKDIEVWQGSSALSVAGAEYKNKFALLNPAEKDTKGFPFPKITFEDGNEIKSSEIARYVSHAPGETLIQPTQSPAEKPSAKEKENVKSMEVPTISALQKEVVALTNQERAKYGLPALTIHPVLSRVAQKYAETMAKYQACHHHVDGTNLEYRVEAEKYDYHYAAENVAAGQKTTEGVVSGWMNSEGHKANILNGKYESIGIGYAFIENDANYYHHYWVQVFGKEMKR